MSRGTHGRTGTSLSGSSSASRGTLGFGIYSATKTTLSQVGRVWAAELAPRGLRVNTIVPGPTDTLGSVASPGTRPR